MNQDDLDAAFNLLYDAACSPMTDLSQLIGDCIFVVERAQKTLQEINS